MMLKPLHSLCCLMNKSLCQNLTFKTTKHVNIARHFTTGSIVHSKDDTDGRMPRAGKYRSPWKILKEEFKGVESMKPPGTDVPRETDVLIIGGAAVGSSIAYWIKQRNPKASNILVVERDPVYTRASSMLSAGGVRHQFSVPENVELSLFATDFLINIKQHLSVIHESPPDVSFNQNGYLFLAPPREAETLAQNVKMQQELGARIELLTKSKLAEKFPWINLDGIECGSLGLEGEGWFDPWSLVRALKQKNISLGVKYVHGELIDFEFTENDTELATPTDKRLDSGVVRLKDGREFEVRFSVVINCAGPWAADVAEMAGIGLGEGELGVPLPVEPKKRFVYVNHCPQGPMLDCPFLIDSTGTYFRREGLGGNYICGSSPTCEKEEPDVANFEVDYDYYDDVVWPNLAKRVPCFENSKLKAAWAGYYEYNTFDQNLIIGPHPYHNNFFFANGLSGHGIQHCLGVGRAAMEYILEGEYKTINLERFHFDRLIANEPILEQGIV